MTNSNHPTGTASALRQISEGVSRRTARVRLLDPFAGDLSPAWHPLGWTPVGFAEIDKFASAVLAERFGSNLPGEPLTQNGVPNFGDFTAIDLSKLGDVDLLVGGTPCQAFSFAGRRLSLADARGNLTLAYAVLAHELARSHGLRNALWENVPGVLSTDDNAFGCFLGALVGADDALPLPRGVERWPDAGMVAGPRARAAWRVLDAQYFGLAQRRERVFVVVDFGNGADPAAVLFEPQGMRGNSPPSRETGQGVATTLAARAGGGGRPDGGDGRHSHLVPEGVAYGGGNRSGPVEVAATLVAKGNKQDFEVETFIAHAPQDADLIAFEARQADVLIYGDIAGPMGTGQPGPTIAFNNTGQGWWDEAEQAATVRKGDDGGGGGARESTIIAHTLRGEGFDASEDGTGRGIPLIPEITGTMKACNESGGWSNSADHAAAGFMIPEPYTLAIRGRGDSHDLEFRQDGLANALLTPNGGRAGMGVGAIAHGWAVRRLTTVECARLQGFPDHHSRIPWRGKPAEQCPDGPQYKTYGNSMARNVMSWLGRQIAKADAARIAA